MCSPATSARFWLRCSSASCATSAQARSRPCMYCVRARWLVAPIASAVRFRVRERPIAVVRLTSASARSPSQLWVIPSSLSRSGSSGDGLARRCDRSTTSCGVADRRKHRLQSQPGAHQADARRTGRGGVEGHLELERAVHPVSGRRACRCRTIARSRSGTSSRDSPPRPPGAWLRSPRWSRRALAWSARGLPRRATAAASSSSLTATRRATARERSPRARSSRTARTTLALARDTSTPPATRRRRVTSAIRGWIRYRTCSAASSGCSGRELVRWRQPAHQQPGGLQHGRGSPRPWSRGTGAARWPC